MPAIALAQDDDYDNSQAQWETQHEACSKALVVMTYSGIARNFCGKNGLTKDEKYASDESFKYVDHNCSMISPD